MCCVAWDNGTGVLPGAPQRTVTCNRVFRAFPEVPFTSLAHAGAELEAWRIDDNFARPHGAFNGKTPYEALREKL